jgi:hypothetical protein
VKGEWEVDKYDVFYRVGGNRLRVGVLPVMATGEWQAVSKFREQMIALGGVEHAEEAKAVRVEKVTCSFGRGGRFVA